MRDYIFTDTLTPCDEPVTKVACMYDASDRENLNPETKKMIDSLHLK